MIQTWKNASLRSQLVAIISALLTVSLLALGATTFLLLHSFLEDQMDAQLQTFQKSIGTVGTVNAENTGANPIGFDYYVGYFYPDGELVDQNRSGQDQPMMPLLTMNQATARATQPFTVPSSDGSDPWRLIVVSPSRIVVTSKDGAPTYFTGYVVIGLPYDSLNVTMERLAVVIAGVAVLAVTLGTMIAYWTVTRSFRPLARVEKTAAAIAAGDLSRRVHIENPSTEVGRLSGSLNAMLAHIESAFAARTASETRMRRFVADASHELRTPLVTIRGYSELYRHGALESTEDVGKAMGRIESEAKRMGELVEDLLLLARIDEQRPLQRKPVDLLLLGHDAVVDARAIAGDRTITLLGLDGGQGTSAPILGDEAKLRQVVANLMGNCLRYTPEGSPLEIQVGTRTESGRQVSVLSIRDHGPGISEAEAPRVFERFYRADTSRNRDTGGSGLGLAIVAAIVAAHSGTVRLEETNGGGATMVITLPFHAVPGTDGGSGEGEADADADAEQTDGADAAAEGQDSSTGAAEGSSTHT
ncbi:ATP-binding protein [Pseudarthrobacter sp. P1]|uniref:sensor histidine kinase n=1 Tax=Pseudarthrobacter sp. P1 TaxID=3418418 RepID=UPI003CEF9189